MKFCQFLGSFPDESLDKRCLLNALHMAAFYHHGQKRKYTSESYIAHPISVAQILLDFEIFDAPTIAAALLHDVLEDCPGASKREIAAKCGPKVETYVVQCSNHYDQMAIRRSERKMREIDRLSKCCSEVQNIKLADAIDNLPSICEFDPKFGRVYLSEKEMLQKSLSSADQKLRQEARKTLEKCRLMLGEKK